MQSTALKSNIYSYPKEWPCLKGKIFSKLSFLVSIFDSWGVRVAHLNLIESPTLGIQEVPLNLNLQELGVSNIFPP